MNTIEPMNTDELHPIQLGKVGLVQMIFANIRPPSLATAIDPVVVTIGESPGAIDMQKHIFTHRIRATYNTSETEHGIATGGSESAPFSMLIELMGVFTFADHLAEEVVRKFQEIGAISILLPYLREHVYSITARAGISPILLPLTKVQIIKITPEGTLSKGE